MEDIDTIKSTGEAKPLYHLSETTVLESPGGYHFIDFLDPVASISPEIDASRLTADKIAYIENGLQYKDERFEKQADVVQKTMAMQSKKVLDIGCGGGLFLSKLKQRGADVMGIELDDARAHYAISRFGLEIVKEPIESDYWQSGRSGSFDAITLWDVIEHVNYPLSTLRSASRVLKRGGFMFIDTPCRDGFYYRFGEISYTLSKGRFPTFLNTLYSAHPFGHKQIFSTEQMRSLLRRIGFKIVALKKVHELSFPYRFYLKKLLQSDVLVRLGLPMVHLLLFMFPVRNKMFVIGRKGG